MARRSLRRKNCTYILNALQVPLKFTAMLFTKLALPTLWVCHWCQCVSACKMPVQILTDKFRLRFSF
jgi:hypothetical protein